MKSPLLSLCLAISFSFFGASFNAQIFSENQQNNFQIDDSQIENLRNAAYSEVQNYILEIQIEQSQKSLVLESNNLLSEQLQSEYPDIRTYDVYDLDDPYYRGKITLDNNNFFLLLETRENGLINIAPDNTSGELRLTRDIQHDHECDADHGTQHQDLHFQEQLNQKAVDNLSFGTEMRNFELVVVATGEFTTLNGGVANAMTVLTNSVNTVNLMFEKDVAVHMNLFDAQLYPDPATDPLTPDNAGGDSRTNQASEVVALNWAQNQYDVGHVFHRSSGGDGWSGGGVAGLGVVCSNSTFFSNENPSDGLSGPIKAAGWSGSFNNTSNGWLQLAAHEFGHMFNAPHTFNGSGASCNSNISSSSAYEIASGTTIMSYQGICSGIQNIPGDGVANNYFHSTSIDRMNTYVSNNSGSCSNDVASGNNPPIVNANPNNGIYIIPGNTPFELEGSASDPEGDALLFNWEQVDEDGLGVLTQGLIGADAGASAIAPLFRSFPPSPDLDRQFPSLPNILAGNNSGNNYEALPSVDRTMNFVFLARDCNPAAGGVSSDGISVEVDGDTGPFEITSFNSGTNNWFANGVTTVNVTWDVAGTDAAPINCGTVDILFSTDNGENFDFLLASGIPNDGSFDLLIPNLSSTQGRLKIKCSNNIFFDINDQIIDIQTGCGAQVHTISPSSNVSADAGDSSLNLSLVEDSSPAPGHSHNFVIVNNTTGLIEDISVSADLSNPINYPQGSFSVYGIEFEDNEDLSPYIGSSFSSLENDAITQTVCAALSTNFVSVQIIFIGCQDPCWTEFGSALPCATFIDADNDGTCDANDECPNDPNKIAPGDCGCGNPDIDTDNDGTADCIDECPNDPLDFCGPCTNACYEENGTSASCATFIDTDNDGTCDIEDECPTDPDKILAGQCGCFTPETDTDNDGTSDCNDNCPTDPNKTEPGTCGCGFVEANISANAGQDETLCNTDYFDLIGNIPSAGTTTWSVVSGPGEIVNPGATTTNIVGVTAGQSTVVQYAISNGNCNSSAQITLQNDIGVTADAGEDQDGCNITSSFNLSAVPQSVGAGQWDLISGIASLGPNNTPNTTLTLGLDMTAQVKWTVFNGACLDDDTITVRNFSQVSTIPDAGPAQLVNCDNSEFELTGNDPINPNYTVEWNITVGAGNFQNGINNEQTVVYENAPTSQVSLLSYSILNGACSSSDNIILFNAQFVPAEAGPDISQCGTSFTMAATAPALGNGQWTVESGTATIASPSNPSTTVEVTSSTATLKWTVTNEACVDEDLIVLVSDDCGASSCSDPCYAENGSSSPCTTFIDSDSDGTCDFNDGCPNDPNKITPGDCGCGVADTDTDMDGTADCNDACPNDSNKITPGDCGCGVADTDSDLDGTADCNDACPNDFFKIAPGDCGCGVEDTDTDLDGTADCIDECPNDFFKIAPGDCGCGVEDTDTDLDGTADCIDECPSDPNKITPGDCGCGVADTDTDLDGTADCNDDCPNDPNKIVPGDCGCGVVDTDTDMDGTADCNDDCPNDPNKIVPGDCGCGVADTDTDMDGTADCDDDCPNDPNKIAPGDCGCGSPDEDLDNDGISDCIDPCPGDQSNMCNDCNDPCYAENGSSSPCTTFIDSDSDGTCDFNDACPNDPNKIAPGDCGCGVADTDSDADGTADCNDACPNDPNKVAPGDCGCGVADTDSDSDGTADCNDACPNDPNKIVPGTCGCGIADEDSNNNGLIDCLEDPNACEAYNFDTAPTGLFNVQSSGTQLLWDHYSDAADGCLLRGGTIGSLDVSAPYTQTPGQVLIQGNAINGLPNGFDNSAILQPEGTFTLFNANTFPAGATGAMVPGAFYKWQVRCGCIIDPSLPFPDRLGASNVHISPWSEFNLFTNLNLPEAQIDSEIGSLDKVIDLKEISIYPNPFEDELVLSLESLNSDLNLVIVNTLGNKVFETKINELSKSNTITINTSEFESGIYIILVHNNTESWTKKLIKN